MSVHVMRLPLEFDAAWRVPGAGSAHAAEWNRSENRTSRHGTRDCTGTSSAWCSDGSARKFRERAHLTFTPAATFTAALRRCRESDDSRRRGAKSIGKMAPRNIATGLMSLRLCWRTKCRPTASIGRHRPERIRQKTARAYSANQSGQPSAPVPAPEFNCPSGTRKSWSPLVPPSDV